MKKIIVIGSGWSGSSAVGDYLSGRIDIVDPFEGSEFRIVGDPGGLYDLHTKLKYTFSVHNANEAIKDFITYCERRSKSMYRKRDTYIAMNLVHEFIEQITLIKYKGLSANEHRNISFHRKLYGSFKKHIARKRGRKAMINTMYYPVDDEKFNDAAKIFINKLVRNGLGNTKGIKCCTIDHGGTFWNPVSSTQYYDYRHVLLVTRDPRDVFAEFKEKGDAYPSSDVKTFCLWYEDMMSRRSDTEWNSEYVTHIKFEDFVTNYDIEKTRIDNIIGLNPQIESSYDPNRSKSNIMIFRDKLQQVEIDEIESKLYKYID